MPDDVFEYWSSISRELAARFHVEQFDTSSAMWSWENFGDEIRTLRNRFGIGDRYVGILGLQVDLESGETLDTLSGKKTNTSQIIPHLYYYSRAQDMGIANDWVKFNTLRGSWACRYSFSEEKLGSLTSVYTDKKDKLFDALERLGARRVERGDAGFEILFLPMVKVLLAFEDADEEFSASVRLLYDRNSIFYLPHEQLGDISWFLASRVLKAI
ncbi:MAG: DUF3786 domain-containing protein [Candidatus Thorarchaeota archaeon]